MFNPGYEASEERYESLSDLVASTASRGEMSHVINSRSGSRTRNSNYDYHQRKDMLTQCH